MVTAPTARPLIDWLFVETRITYSSQLCGRVKTPLRVKARFRHLLGERNLIQSPPEHLAIQEVSSVAFRVLEEELKIF